MLKNKDILDEKDKKLRQISKEVTFPLDKKDKETIDLIIEYLTNSQIESLAEKYDLRLNALDRIFRNTDNNALILIEILLHS